MILPLVAIGIGLIVLVWSADRFVDGASAAAHYFGMPPLLIGMVIVGFGTSAPELVVSIFAAAQGNSGIALGNAYGSNIVNIALILGLTAIVSPITVRSQILRKELPILTLVTLFAGWQLLDFEISRADAMALLGVFSVLLGWSVYQGINARPDSFSDDMVGELEAKNESLKADIFWLVLGLVLLIASSRLLVWGAVELAQHFGVSDLIIGLTVVALGTSLPELASSLIAIRKGEHDIALGNVLGSNLFNTLAVVGLAGVIQPLHVPQEVLYRDVFAMFILTVLLFVIGYGFTRKGSTNRIGIINRYEGALLLLFFVAYNIYLIMGSIS